MHHFLVLFLGVILTPQTGADCRLEVRVYAQSINGYTCHFRFPGKNVLLFNAG